MDHLAVCESNLLKLGGYLHLTLIHNPAFLFVDLIICLWFMDVNKQPKLAPFKKPLKSHQYGYQMKGPGLGSKNMLLVFQFSCLFTFHKHKQQFVYILKKH
jgi:hypothetical protein